MQSTDNIYRNEVPWTKLKLVIKKRKPIIAIFVSKQKFKDIDQEETDVPAWHKSIVKERLASYKSQPDQVMDFNSAMDDVEKDLKCLR